MTVAAAHTIEHGDFAAVASRLRFRSEIEPDVLPGVAALRLQPESGTRLIAAMDHAIFAATVACDAVDHAVTFPLRFLEQLGITGIVAVRHQVTWAFPPTNVARRNGPGRAREVAFAGEKFEIDRRPEKDVTIHPVLDLLEFLDRHPAGEEEILRAQIEPLDHVLFRGVVVVARRDRVTVHAEIGEIIRSEEHTSELQSRF